MRLTQLTLRLDASRAEPSGLIALTVIDGSATPVGDAIWRICPLGVTGTTDVQRAALISVPAGTYTVKAARDDVGFTEETGVAVTVGNTSVVQLPLTEPYEAPVC